MARPTRRTAGGYLYHVLNRANGRLGIFKRRTDFLAFENILGQAQQRISMRICGYCLMPNHWHLLLYPHRDGDLSEFMRWVTITHTMHYHYSHGTAGTGHLYQGRFKSFPIQQSRHLLSVLRYIKANPLRANTVKNAADYRWSSYRHHIARLDPKLQFHLSNLPLKLPRTWKQLVHKTPPEKQTAPHNQLHKTRHLPRRPRMDSKNPKPPLNHKQKRKTKKRNLTPLICTQLLDLLKNMVSLLVCLVSRQLFSWIRKWS